MGKASRNKRLRRKQANRCTTDETNDAENNTPNLRIDPPSIEHHINGACPACQSPACPCIICHGYQLFADYQAPHFAPTSLRVPYTCQACGRGEQRPVPNFWKLQAQVAIQKVDNCIAEG